MLELASDDALAVKLGRAAYDWYWKDHWTTESQVNALIGHYVRVPKLTENAAAARASVQRFTLTAANPP